MAIISQETFDKFSEEEKQEILKRYSQMNIDIKNVSSDYLKEWTKGQISELEQLFGKENLQPVLTYEDVARELFMEKRVYYFDWDENDKIESVIHCKAEDWYKAPLNCTSERQGQKLKAINKLLNVAKFLNKNEDGSDWKPDFKNIQDKWYLAIEKGKIKVDYHDDGHNSHIIYFRTKELAKQAVQILGEDVVRTALGNY